MISLFYLTSAPTGVQLHAPATPNETAPVILNLCGSPSPSAVSACPSLKADGSWYLEGNITSSLHARWNLQGQQLFAWLDDGLVYINAHIPANPMGEARGRFYPR